MNKGQLKPMSDLAVLRAELKIKRLRSQFWGLLSETRNGPRGEAIRDHMDRIEARISGNWARRFTSI